MRAAYIQSVGGASGDMLLGALLDAGVTVKTIAGVVDSLNIEGVVLEGQTRRSVRSTGYPRRGGRIGGAPIFTPANA